MFRTLALLTFLAPFAANALAAEHVAPAAYRMEVRLDPGTRSVHGRAELEVRDAPGFELLLGAAFELGEIRIDDKVVQPRSRTVRNTRRFSFPAGAAGRSIRFEWRGVLPPMPEGMQHRDTLGQRAGYADPRGSFLPVSALWYPLIVRENTALPHTYRVRIVLPEEVRGLVPGTLASDEVRDGRRFVEFDFPHPSEGISLIAGPYRVDEREHRSVDGRRLQLRTWFHPTLEALVPGYLESTVAYIDMYEHWIGPYPFASFSIVSSPTPTGFGLPTLTYLGIDVLRLPFIRGSSLGHEVLHNWWGNGVYTDYAQGNWSEGLTTFMADYTYALNDSDDAARAMRLGWLRDLSGIPDGADQPLFAFTSRHHGVSHAVGYGKSAMLFAMLRDHIGEDAFDRGVRRFWREQRFGTAAWDDLRAAFEAESGEPLQGFFTQWLTRAGLPQIALEGAEQAGSTLRIELTQAGPPWSIDVPLHVETEHGEQIHRVRLDHAKQHFELAVGGKTLRVRLDPDSRILRRLDRHETPPILREVQLDPATRVVALGEDAFAAAADTLSSRLLDDRRPRSSSTSGADPAPLLVIGPSAEIATWLSANGHPPPPVEVAERGDARAWTFRAPSGKAVVIVAAETPAALEGVVRPLPHHGRQSWLVFEQGRTVDRGSWPARIPTIELTPR